MDRFRGSSMKTPDYYRYVIFLISLCINGFIIVANAEGNYTSYILMLTNKNVYCIIVYIFCDTFLKRTHFKR